MPVYGDSLHEWAERLKRLLPPDRDLDGQRREWSMEVAVHLGLALAALQRLEAGGVSVEMGNRRLVEGALEAAYRELLHIRLRNIPAERLLDDVPRIVSLSRTGRIINGTDTTPLSTYRYMYSDPDRVVESDPGAEGRARRPRHRRRGAQKPDQPAAG